MKGLQQSWAAVCSPSEWESGRDNKKLLAFNPGVPYVVIIVNVQIFTKQNKLKMLVVL